MDYLWNIDYIYAQHALTRTNPFYELGPLGEIQDRIECE
jgi:hypothetical protein